MLQLNQQTVRNWIDRDFLRAHRRWRRARIAFRTRPAAGGEQDPTASTAGSANRRRFLGRPGAPAPLVIANGDPQPRVPQGFRPLVDLAGEFLIAESPASTKRVASPPGCRGEQCPWAPVARAPLRVRPEMKPAQRPIRVRILRRRRRRGRQERRNPQPARGARGYPRRPRPRSRGSEALDPNRGSASSSSPSSPGVEVYRPIASSIASVSSSHVSPVAKQPGHSRTSAHSLSTVDLHVQWFPGLPAAPHIANSSTARPPALTVT